MKISKTNCVRGLSKLKDVDLIFADPPFNIGQDYANYDDRMDDVQFASFFHLWINYAATSLREGGILVVHIPFELISLTSDAAKNAGLIQYDNVVWNFGFAQNCTTKHPKSDAHAIYFYKPPKELRTWNGDQVQVPTDRATKYNDPRTTQSATPGMKVVGNVWGGPFMGRVQGNNKERVVGRPNQLPEMYVARFIRSLSNPGDLVVDPFLGTGTTAVVCQSLGRNFIGFDLDADAVKLAKKRLKRGVVRDVTNEDWIKAPSTRKWHSATVAKRWGRGIPVLTKRVHQGQTIYEALNEHRPDLVDAMVARPGKWSFRKIEDDS